MIFFPLFFQVRLSSFWAFLRNLYLRGLAWVGGFFFFHFLDSAVLASSGGSSPFESELCNLLWRGIIRVFGFLELDSRVEPPVVCGRGASVGIF